MATARAKRQKRARATNDRSDISDVFGDIEDGPSRCCLRQKDYRRHSRDYHTFTQDEVETVRRELLSWYDDNRRMLPWRGDPPPWSKTGDVARQKDAANKKASIDRSQPTLSAFFSSSSSNKSNSSGGGKGCRQNDRGGRRECGDVGNNSESHRDGSVGADSPQNNGGKQGGGKDTERIPASAYGTWVSEVMLQQTRVETVVEYFVKWMKLFPTPEALAEADLEQVNSVWAGLGYYRRAKMLHEGARKVLEVHGGCLPSTAKELKEIPGIGPYTAGAVASIAFGQREPLVDGNVIRVLSRLKAIASDPKNASLNKLCWDLAGNIVDPDRPGDFNQALMELGATVCTAKSPSCSACPLKDACLARALTSGEPRKTSPSGGPHGGEEMDANKTKREKVTKMELEFANASVKAAGGGDCGCDVCELGEDGLAELPLEVTEFPRKAAKTVVKEQTLSVAVVERDSKTGSEVLLVKRPDTGLLAGQWECPCVLLTDGSEKTDDEGKETKKGKEFGKLELTEEERQRRVNSLLFSELGIARDNLKSRQGVGEVVHVFSHLRHTMQVERVQVGGENRKSVGARKGNPTREIRWVDVDDMGGVGITTGMKKVLALATKSRDAGGAGITKRNKPSGKKRSAQ